MAEQQAEGLHSEIKSLADDVGLNDGLLGLSPEQLAIWVERLRARSDRRELALHLVILAHRFGEAPRRAGALAVAQLAFLSALLLDDTDAALDLMAAAGADPRVTARALGQGAMSYDLERDPHRSTASLLGVLKSKKEEG